ncbi:uncharacterized protein LOC132752597 [Ruditapes philippinarum]|uniref:uncharacterized protein LOC132752597 n=1 Tax=Ruditapes philippinarum TaxID=129788 RepID=UPI00295C2EA9|nr:uncharacterized protein LOC132752597 [Ruditapes philippinarum]
MATKLRSVQKGHKGAVTRLLNKFEIIQREAADYEELVTIIDSLKQKQQTITEIHEKILDSFLDEEEEQIETEILEHDEYIYMLKTKIQKIHDFRKVSISNLNYNSPALNPNAQPFQASVSSETSEMCAPGISENTSQMHFLPSLSQSSVYHKLPKLDLPKFDGNVLDWCSFWDSYESAIHTNLSLSGVQKFNYLKSCLKNEALQTIAGFALTNVNYEQAISLLHERYGQKDRIIQTYMKALLEVPAPRYTIQSVRKFYNTTETYIRALASLNQNETTYGSLLTPVILQKLQPDVRTNITRAHGIQSWTLRELMKCILNEINILDAGNLLNTPQDFIPTATFLTKSDSSRTERKNTPIPSNLRSHRQRCVFCKGEHSCIDCAKFKDREQRMNIVKERRLCFNCLGNHKITDCKSKFKCKICSRRHHTSICGVEKEAKSTDKYPVINNEKKNSTSVLHSAHSTTPGPVLLKTAVSMVTSKSTSISANILFDEGSQSSFISEHLAQKLQLEPTGSETLYMSGFGDTERRVRHLSRATVYLETAEENIPINVLIVPEISMPLKSYHKHAGHLPYLKGLKLAHPVSGDEDFDIEILIGADHYWDVVQDEVIRGDGPTAILSKIGYLLSGPLKTGTLINSTSIPVSMMNVITMKTQDVVNLEKFWEVESIGVEQKPNQQLNFEKTREYSENSITYSKENYVDNLPQKDDHYIISRNEHISRPRTMPHHPVRKDSEKICVINDRTLIYTFMYTYLIDPSHLLCRRRITSPVYPDDRELTTRGLNEPVEELYILIDATLERFFSRWKHKYLTLLRESH